MKQITKRQHEVLLVIKKYIAKHKCSPTYQEIADRIGGTIRGAVQNVEALEKKGFIGREKNVARSIFILTNKQ